MRTLELIESTETLLDVTEEEADQLRSLGRSLASDRRWWGESEDDEPRSRTIIRCERQAPGRHRVLVSDAIGAIGLGGLQLIVRPKIPTDHLLFLLSQSSQVPRLAGQRASIDTDQGFFELIARWFVDAAEALLRHDLIRDYHPRTADLPFARGRIDVGPTSKALLAGRTIIRCSFDEYSEDNALNRVLRAASRVLAASPGLPAELRRQARRIGVRLQGAGDLRHLDIRSRPDARTRHYRDAHPLALAILAGNGVRPTGGETAAWTFLFRTPEAVEEGVRELLRSHLKNDWAVRKRGRSLQGDRSRTLNPDLVFDDGVAVGDVKYRLSKNGDISRSHLNQVTTFATGYGSRAAMVISFGSADRPEHLRVGSVQVQSILWPTDVADPEVAGAVLCGRVRGWLSAALSSPVASS